MTKEELIQELETNISNLQTLHKHVVELDNKKDDDELFELACELHGIIIYNLKGHLKALKKGC